MSFLLFLTLTRLKNVNIKKLPQLDIAEGDVFYNQVIKLSLNNKAEFE